MANQFLKQYKEQRDRLKQHFEAEKTGEQTLFTDQAKLFKPIIESQKETSKAIRDEIVANQENSSNVLTPFIRELQKRNEQTEAMLKASPQGIQDVPQSTPLKDFISVDIDGEMLNDTHKENLQDMGFDLPSMVQRKGIYADVLKQIKTENRRLGQVLSEITAAGKKIPAKEKAVYESRKQTLKLYKGKIKLVEAAQQVIVKSGEGLRKLVKPKRGRGRPRQYPDVVLYNHPDELCKKLYELEAAKAAGNTGLDNIINAILDELLDIKYIDKTEYNNLYKNIF